MDEFFDEHQYAMSVTEYAMRGYPKASASFVRDLEAEERRKEAEERRKEAEEWAKSYANLITPSIPCGVCGNPSHYELIWRKDRPGLDEALANMSKTTFCWNHGG